MNKLFSHNHLTKKYLIYKLFVALLPLLIYGLYKNGFLLYFNHLISGTDILLLILYPILGAFVSVLITSLKRRKITINHELIYGLIIGMIIPISTNILIYLITIIIANIILSFVNTKFNLNKIVVIKLLIVIILLISNSYNYGNLLEQANEYSYSFLDIIFGRNLSGIFTSSSIIIFLSYLYLTSNPYYKKDIFIFTIIPYFIACLIYGVLINDYGNIIINIFNSNILFAIVFVASQSLFSPANRRARAIYGLLLGTLIIPLSLVFNFFEGVYIAILLVNILNKILDNIFIKKLGK